MWNATILHLLFHAFALFLIEVGGGSIRKGGEVGAGEIFLNPLKRVGSAPLSICHGSVNGKNYREISI